MSQTFARGDFNRYELATQLETFSAMNIEKNGDSITFHDIHKHFKILDHNATSSKGGKISAFNASYQCSIRKECLYNEENKNLPALYNRLNNVMVLHIHKYLTDNLNCIKILNEFTSAKEDRRQQFGKFE